MRTGRFSGGFDTFGANSGYGSFSRSRGPSVKLIVPLAALAIGGTCNLANFSHQETFRGVVTGRDSHVEISTTSHTDDDGNTHYSTTSRTVREIGLRRITCGGAMVQKGEMTMAQNNSSLWAWKWDAPTWQMQLEPGKAFEITTAGHRLPPFVYPNIISFRVLDEKACPGITEYLADQNAPTKP